MGVPDWQLQPAGIYTKEDAANMIDLMAPGVRDALMGTLMEPALHAVEAIARQATLGDRYAFALAITHDLMAY